MKWFKHDSNANTDAKLKKVRMKYGLEGYGLYWLLLEYISAGVESHNLNFELEHDAEVISHDTNIHIDRIQEMMRYMVELKLFDSMDGRVFCLKMATRTDEYTQKLLKNSKGVPTVSRQTPDSVDTKSVLLEEKRVEESRREKKTPTRRFTPPSLQEVTDYCNERGNSVGPQAFLDHYEANGWMRGKNKIKDWKACVRTWEKNSAKVETNEHYY